ncbi:dynamin family protein [Shewanella sp. A3A]|nr:dynamin family protein [Shewanella ferrihydritica]
MQEEMSLEQMRKDAGLSQAQLAAQLNLSQSQVSKYEQNPDDVSMKVYRAWQAYCGKVASSVGLKFDVAPMSEIQSRTTLIENYCSIFPEIPEDYPRVQLENGNNLLSIDSFIEGVNRITRKPRIGIFGRFDMGKSRLANFLIGGDNLPTSYQPATSITCLIRHIDDKPAWQPESVWILSEGFDLDRPDDEEHCKKHRLIGGEFDTLKVHGTHSSDKNTTFENAVAAIVYIDSPFLTGCDLIDLPGYQHQDGDDKRAEMAQKIADIVIYVSTAQGFMNEHDRAYLSQLINNLPTVEIRENELPPLSNLFVVATRADMVGSDINQVLDTAARHSFDSIGESLQKRGDIKNGELKLADFRSRFFTYSIESGSLREHLNRTLKDLLEDIFPKKILEETDKYVTQIKLSGSDSIREFISNIQSTIENRERAQEQFEKIKSRENERTLERNRHIEHVRSIIQNFKESTEENVHKVCLQWIDADKIEKVIKERYVDKKEAQELAATYIVKKIQNVISEDVDDKAKLLSEEVDDYLKGYDNTFDPSNLDVSLNFNASGAFAGALAGLGTFGALATWSSIAAAGSNLGGYILLAEVVSALSAAGISLGGTASVASIVSALGGPVTIAIGISVAVGALVYALMGNSWERRLSKKIVKILKDEEIEQTIIDELNNYWDVTLSSFNYAANKTEEDFQEKLRNLEELAFSTDIETLEKHKLISEELKSFFSGIPWKKI